jgi:hypothetical protein
MKRLIFILSFTFVLVKAQAQAPDFIISRTNGSSGLAICSGESVTFQAGSVTGATSYKYYINDSPVTSDENVGLAWVFIKLSWGYPVGSTIRCEATTPSGTKYSNTLTTTSCIPPQLPSFTVGIQADPFRYPATYCVGEGRPTSWDREQL